MTARLIAVLRQPQVLVGIVSQPVPGTYGVTFREHNVALGQLPEALCPWRERDNKAWRSLSNVPSISRRAGKAIIRCIIGTATNPATRPYDLTALNLATPPRDLRPHLCTPSGEQYILDSLSHALGDGLEAISDDTGFPDWHWRCRAEIAALPAEFQRSFLWSLHLAPWTSVMEISAIFAEFALANNEELRMATSRLLSVSGPSAFIRWANSVEQGDKLASIARELSSPAAQRARSVA